LAAAAFDAAWARQEEGKDRVTAIGSVGFCGGLDPGLGVGDIVIATRVLAPEHGRNYDCQPVRTSLQAAHGAVLSVDRVAVTTDEKAELRQSGAVAVEMEAAAVAQAAGQHRVPFFALRVVSDTARDGFVINMNEMRNAAGRFDRARILRAALARPLRRIAALGRLNRHCRIAEERLGEFFASCRFE
jgi:adenosylhomocysteine nucleosidase